MKLEMAKSTWDKEVVDAKEKMDRGEVRQALERAFGNAITEVLMEALYEGFRRTYY